MSIEWYLVIVGSHLVAISVGYAFGKPYVDRWQQRIHAAKMPKSAPKTTASLPAVQKPTVP